MRVSGLLENRGYAGSVQLFEQVARVKESFNRLRNTGPHNVPEGFEEDTLETLRARRFEGFDLVKDQSSFLLTLWG